MSSQTEEVVIQPCLFHAEQFFPPAGQRILPAFTVRCGTGRRRRVCPWHWTYVALVEVCERLRDSEQRERSPGQKNARQSPRAVEWQYSRRIEDFNRLLPAAERSIARWRNLLGSLGGISNAAHRKAFNLRQHLVQLIEKRDVERYNLAMKHILPAGTDVAE